MCVQAMVDTYKNNPSFADEKTKAKVKGEYETVQEKVGEEIEMKLLITKILFQPGQPGGGSSVRPEQAERRNPSGVGAKETAAAKQEKVNQEAKFTTSTSWRRSTTTSSTSRDRVCPTPTTPARPWWPSSTNGVTDVRRFATTSLLPTRVGRQHI